MASSKMRAKDTDDSLDSSTVASTTNDENNIKNQKTVDPSVDIMDTMEDLDSFEALSGTVVARIGFVKKVVAKFNALQSSKFQETFLSSISKQKPEPKKSFIKNLDKTEENNKVNDFSKTETKRKKLVDKIDINSNDIKIIEAERPNYLAEQKKLWYDIEQDEYAQFSQKQDEVTEYFRTIDFVLTEIWDKQIAARKTASKHHNKRLKHHLGKKTFC